jgi:hypothetical protein
MTIDAFINHIKEYQYVDGVRTRVEQVQIDGEQVPQFINEFWTAKQRQASSLHEVSYRACFKPQLPRFFIQALTAPGDIVYDPFSGRGTTGIEAGLLGRRAIANDVNPLSALLSEPRFFVPSMDELHERLDSISLAKGGRAEIDLSMFYHRDTEAEIVALRDYLLERACTGEADWLDKWIQMVATNRLTGHSGGFFSVYTLPPNQAVTPERQVLINHKRNQSPEYKDIKSRILKKSVSLIRNLADVEIDNLREVGATALFLENDARRTPEIESESVMLTVTSPPFLDVVQYSQDNWLRCWFNGIRVGDVAAKITMAKSVSEWAGVMQDVFNELYRITKPGGWVTFEVGEVKNGTVKLDEYVVPLGKKAGFSCGGVLLNVQEFTKTANIWGIKNNSVGTNTNRVVLFCKES